MIILPKQFTPSELMVLAQTIESDAVQGVTVIDAYYKALQHLKATGADASALDILVRIHALMTGKAAATAPPPPPPPPPPVEVPIPLLAGLTAPLAAAPLGNPSVLPADGLPEGIGVMPPAVPPGTVPGA